MVLHCCVAAFSVASRHLVCCGTPLLLRGVMLLWCLCGVLVALCVLWYSIAASRRLVCCGTPLLHRGVCASRRGGAGHSIHCGSLGGPWIAPFLCNSSVVSWWLLLCCGTPLLHRSVLCAVLLHCCIAACVCCSGAGRSILHSLWFTWWSILVAPFHVIFLWCLGGALCAVVLHCCIAPFSVAPRRVCVCVAAGRGGPLCIHLGLELHYGCVSLAAIQK